MATISPSLIAVHNLLKAIDAVRECAKDEHSGVAKVAVLVDYTNGDYTHHTWTKPSEQFGVREST